MTRFLCIMDMSGPIYPNIPLSSCMFGWGGGEEAPLNFSPINTPRYRPCHPSITLHCFLLLQYLEQCVLLLLPGAALKANWRVTNSQSLSRLGSYGTYNTFGTCGSQALTFGTNDIYGTCIPPFVPAMKELGELRNHWEPVQRQCQVIQQL